MSNDNLTAEMGLGPASIEMPLAEAVPVASPGAVASPSAASAPIVVPAAPPIAPTMDPAEHITIYVDYEEYNSPDDNEADIAAIALANDSRDATSPKVLGISHTIYHKVDCIEQGINILKGAIDHGDALQLLQIEWCFLNVSVLHLIQTCFKTG
ncbi:uncharacterized protein BJ212DRAFT_1303903 [Suillus subaureus]|uniref:Uncharacterized protein n=1 Tax=Suillus subaureus TaxID=48587 RepID=A0A9P7J6Z5_9AGAM|nr:uncharacterized protein BJ212DRAFT_1303903 [Suillus subaureus]KAG1805842.1 hypothetical protein BJ212DRAFT_1303903 [Suillus subaureus]